jgi:hypothetical protein
MIPCEAIITADDKLEVVQRLDRRWHSLSDKICCTRCGRIFSASQIAVLGGSRAFGPIRLHCPNEDCLATPKEWTKSSSANARSSQWEVPFHRSEQVRFVRRRKQIHATGEVGPSWIKKSTAWIASGLCRLDASWAAFWARLGHPLSRADAKSTDSMMS